MPLRTGQPLAGPVEVTVGMTTVGEAVKPAFGDEAQSVEVAKHQIRGELRLRLFERGELAIIHERGLAAKANKIDATQADVGPGDPWAVGTAVRYAVTDGGPFAIGLDFETLRWEIPYVEDRTCVENCDGVPLHQVDHGGAGQWTLGLGVTPSYRLGRWTVFGGVFMRNHPTVERKGEEFTSTNDEDVSSGPVNWLVHAGAAAQFGAITALLLVHQDVTTDPVRYGPAIGFALSGSLSGAFSPPARPSRPPPPPRWETPSIPEAPAPAPEVPDEPEDEY